MHINRENIRVADRITNLPRVECLTDLWLFDVPDTLADRLYADYNHVD